MKKLMAVGFLAALAAAFAAGYWLQREPLARSRAELDESRRRLAETQSELAREQARARVGRLFGQLLALRDAVSASNYAEAQALSSTFFDAVREEAGRTGDAAVRTALDAVLIRRDTVTAALARGEAGARELLAPIERELRRALGYPLPSATVAPATTP